MQFAGSRRDTVMRIILIILIILTAAGIFIYKNRTLPETGHNQSAQNLPTLLEFSSTTCPPCQSMVPILEELQKEYKEQINIKTVDINEHPEEAEKYSIILLPTQILLDGDGNVIGRHEGYISKENLVKVLKKEGVI
jgi:thioredoxin 1